jgi:dTDP-glucose 4,6-dehydratase
MLESWCRARRDGLLQGELVVLSRNPGPWADLLGGCPGLRFLEGDQASFPFPQGPVDGVIHAALEQGPSEGVLEGNLEGCRRALALARERGSRRFLLLSSGAVYGPQPPDLPGLPETWPLEGEAEGPAGVYQRTKRLQEGLCAGGPWEGGRTCVVARGFAFHGPGLPLDRHFAVGDFLLDALAGGPIRVLGDGRPIRSYLYGADMALGLWAMFALGAHGRPYNLGSPRGCSIAELAEAVRQAIDPSLEVRVEVRPAVGQPSTRYVPDVSRAASELGLAARIPLGEGLRRTAAWLRGG